MKFLSKLANQIERGRETEFEAVSRRVWLQNFGAITASSVVLWACGKDDSKAVETDSKKIDYVADGKIINVAIGLENEAIALYTAAAGLDDVWASKDYGSTLLTIAGSFLAHHKEHLATLQGALKAAKAKDAKVDDEVSAKTADEYLAANSTADLGTIKGILRLAAKKEMEAAQAYLSVVPKFTDPNLANFSGLHGGDEAAHYGALRAALLAVVGDTDVKADKVIPASLPTGFTANFP